MSYLCPIIVTALIKQKFRCIVSIELFLLVFNCREKLPEDEEFAIAGDLAELEAKPIEQTNGKQEANGTIENKGIVGILFVFKVSLDTKKEHET